MKKKIKLDEKKIEILRMKNHLNTRLKPMLQIIDDTIDDEYLRGFQSKEKLINTIKEYEEQIRRLEDEVSDMPSR